MCVIIASTVMPCHTVPYYTMLRVIGVIAHFSHTDTDADADADTDTGTGTDADADRHRHRHRHAGELVSQFNGAQKCP